MRLTLIAVLCVFFLSSCRTLDTMNINSPLESIGDFELTPTPTNGCWSNGFTFEYNEYRIKMTSEPRAKIIWQGKQIGATPFVYRFTGSLERGDAVIVRAVPFDEALDEGRRTLMGSEQLPRDIHFDLERK
ncbi:MAG: hypothetical protein ABH885_04850 [Candidatus Omnitrophota bacterium]